jgi:hypothetical protein
VLAVVLVGVAAGGVNLGELLPGGAGGTQDKPSSPVEVWAVGDGGDGSERAKRVGRMIAATRPARFLYLGDVYPTGTRAEFERNYKPVFGALDRITLPTPGNHEWPLHAEGYDPYWLGVYGRPMPTTYSTRIRGWDLLSLNSENVGTSGSPQMRWLSDQVRTGGTCRLAFWHRPRFSAGLTHGDDPSVEPFWRQLRGRAALIVNAHEHNLQEFRPRNGIRQLIAGAGGKSLYGVRAEDPRLAWSNATDYGALRLRLSHERADWAFVALDGRVLRRGTTRCAPG